MNLIQHYVGGELITGSSNRKGKVFNPALGEQKSEVILANKSDLDKTVLIAKKAFESWSSFKRAIVSLLGLAYINHLFPLIHIV